MIGLRDERQITSRSSPPAGPPTGSGARIRRGSGSGVGRDVVIGVPFPALWWSMASQCQAGAAARRDVVEREPPGARDAAMNRPLSRTRRSCVS